MKIVGDSFDYFSCTDCRDVKKCVFYCGGFTYYYIFDFNENGYVKSELYREDLPDPLVETRNPYTKEFEIVGIINAFSECFDPKRDCNC